MKPVLALLKHNNRCKHFLVRNLSPIEEHQKTMGRSMYDKAILFFMIHVFFFFFGDIQPIGPIQKKNFLNIFGFNRSKKTPLLSDYKSMYNTYDKTNYIFGMRSTRAIYLSTQNYLITVGTKCGGVQGVCTILSYLIYLNQLTDFCAQIHLPDRL